MKQMTIARSAVEPTKNTATPTSVRTPDDCALRFVVRCSHPRRQALEHQLPHGQPRTPRLSQFLDLQA